THQPPPHTLCDTQHSLRPFSRHTHCSRPASDNPRPTRQTVSHPEENDPRLRPSAHRCPQTRRRFPTPSLHICQTSGPEHAPRPPPASFPLETVPDLPGDSLLHRGLSASSSHQSSRCYIRAPPAPSSPEPSHCPESFAP